MIIFYDLFFSLHIPQATHSFLPGTMLLEAVSEENKRIRCQSPAPAARGISLKGWAVLVGNDVASDSRYGTTCLFQASGLLLYFFKSLRSKVLHFQLPLTQIYYLLVLQTKFLLQRFSQNHVYLWLHCNSCLSLGCIPHFSVYLLSF